MGDKVLLQWHTTPDLSEIDAIRACQSKETAQQPVRHKNATPHPRLQRAAEWVRSRQEADGVSVMDAGCALSMLERIVSRGYTVDDVATWATMYDDGEDRSPLTETNVLEAFPERRAS